MRRTTPQLMKSGNLWDKGHKVFNALPEDYRPRWIKGEKKMAIFKHGPIIEYSHCQHMSDLENYQGSEMTGFFIDEGCQFEWEMISYLFSRMRSDSKYPSRMVISCNPLPDHKIAEMIDWYLDEEGYPDKEKEGKYRYFLIVDDDFVWSSDPQELIDKYRTDRYTPKPLSFSFVSSTIYDNKICMEQNPGYVSFLEGLNRVEKARLLFGNWKIRPDGANYFDRKWLNKLDYMPRLVTRARAWDKASTEPNDNNRQPDFSACVGMGKTENGDIVIFGNYCDENYDEETETHGRFRKRPGEREEIILLQAIHDGDNTTIIMPEDPSSSGKSEFISSSKKLIEEGFIVRKDPACPTSRKLKRFEPFSAACQNRLVFIVESSFDIKTLNYFYKELEAFDGERSSRTRKDDMADATATAFNYISQKKNIPIVCRRQQTHNTMSKNLIDSMSL